MGEIGKLTPTQIADCEQLSRRGVEYFVVTPANWDDESSVDTASDELLGLQEILIDSGSTLAGE
jgi:riboflavin biosynthesis pyrimidine reductase